jgi:hypothetical protein
MLQHESMLLPGLPDFSWYMIPKLKKYISNGQNINQMSVGKNIPNGH